MTVDERLYSVLSSFVGGRAYPDTAPELPQTPFIIYQQVGGTPINFYDGVPDKRNGRFQVNVWSGTRAEAISILRQVEDALRLDATLRADTLGGLLSTYDDTPRWYGAQQDFSIWF